MKTFLWIVAGLVAVLLVASLVLYLAGSRMPREHRAQISLTLHAERAVVWAALTDYASMPAWWPAVKAVRFEKLPDGTELTWNTDRHGDAIAYRTKIERPRELLVREIVGDPVKALFGGTWTYSLADAPGGATILTLTEDGFINPPLFRSMAKWFFGLDTTMKDFAANFEKHLAQKTAP